ncbi:DBP7 [Candida pseudojiufengensis]|uniref:DBP7 n=1 Tax=Candida pseudojiufengensis TaxID=497109 RepID=UPI0022247A16|nr:DBP7 [Candida pseudojiufengensis]KAI5960821.1 DBP7 [Candida pseudojiufengensis]
MSDDDGLMLNFAIPDTTSTTTQQKNVKVRGGRWKDRRTLQLKLEGRPKEKKMKGSNSIPIDLNRKRRIEEYSSRKVSKPSTNQSNTNESKSEFKRAKFNETKGEHGGKNDSYVSSLFTNNSESTQPQPEKDSSSKEEEEIKTYLPSNAPIKDATTFNGLGINEKLTNHLINHQRFKYPTKIQKLVIPNLLTTQRDIFVKAQTGSGKTMAFILPIFHKLMMENKFKIGRDSGVFAIILTPTRELANQIYSVLENLNRCYPFLVPGIVIGGEKKKSEKARLRKGVNILVATPGRLADHLENTKTLDVSQLRYLVLDEGDKLVELGFEETISKITKIIDNNSKINETIDKWQGLPTKRINILCSATLQNNVKQLGNIILNNPEMISVDREVEGTILFDDDPTGEISNNNNEHESFAPDQLIQNILIVPPKLRLVTLDAELVNISNKIDKNQDTSRTIVFFSCSDSVNYHFDIFTRNGKKFKKIKDEETGETKTILVSPEDSINEENDENDAELTSPIINKNTIIYKLHGSLTQQTRTTILQQFIKDDSKFSNKILFCTDVASRGLDLPNISNVIEYDPPFTIDDHLHRIGRSARVGEKGIATLFLLPGLEEGYIESKLKIVHPRKENLRIIKYENILSSAFSEKDSTTKNKYDKLGNWDIHATTWHLEVERWVLENSQALSKASQAFISHIRAYATHLSQERNFFNVKNLHLGHLAKSFGLRETPKSLGKKSNKNNEKFNNEIENGRANKFKKEDPRKKMLRMAKLAVNSTNEYNY